MVGDWESELLKMNPKAHARLKAMIDSGEIGRAKPAGSGAIGSGQALTVWPSKDLNTSEAAQFNRKLHDAVSDCVENLYPQTSPYPTRSYT